MGSGRSPTGNLPGRSWVGRIRRAAVFVLVQVVVVLVALELVIRLAGTRLGLRTVLYLPAAESFYDRADTLEQLMDRSILGFRPYATYYGFVLNSRSLRTREYALRPPPGTRRLLAFGDSFTFASGGLPHRWHWPTVLESELAADGPVEVLRFGVPGTGPLFQYRLWQLEGSRLGADTVVQAFFIGNDFRDGQGRSARLLGDGSSLDNRLALHWWTFRVARNLARALRSTVSPAVREHGPDGGTPRGGVELPEYEEHFTPNRGAFDLDTYREIEARRMEICRRDLDAEFEQLLDDVGWTLVAFDHEVTASGGRFLVMLIPDEFQVDPAVREDVMVSAGTSADDYDLARPQRRLGEWLGAHGIETLDLLPAFAEIGASRRLYNLRDTHWNRDGNRLAAELLAARLRARDPERVLTAWRHAESD